MGRPLTGKNRYPFGVDGINVDAAKLIDGTVLTNIRIHKQRSAWVFDLMSKDGNTIYEYVQLLGVDSTGMNLDPADDQDTLASKLKPGSFCLSIVDQSPTPVVLGFAIRLLTNKVILQNGKILYANKIGFQGDTTVDVTGLSVLPKTANVNVGSTVSISATIEPTNATNKNIIWSVDNESFATVNGGIVTGVSAGTAIVTATSSADASFKDTATVTVNDVYVMNATPNPVSITNTTTQQITVSGTKNGIAYTPSPTYTSSASSIFTVSSTGLVTGVAAGTGKVTIAEAGKYSIEVDVTVSSTS